MLSTTEIFRDSSENANVLAAKSVKSNLTGKVKGLKNSTNVHHDRKSASDNREELKKPSYTSKKEISSSESASVSLKSDSGEFEKYPEVENMYIYDEPEDDYEDILPKCERITNEEMDCLFELRHFGKLVELTVDPIPKFSMEPFKELKFEFPSFEMDEGLLYDNSPVIEFPDFV